MRFVVASLIAFAASTATEPWKTIGGDLAYVGPSFNATYKVQDHIPFEYAFYTPKFDGTTSTCEIAAPSTGIATLTSLSWVGKLGSLAVDVKLNNDRDSGYSVPCLATDPCTGNYYPKRIDLIIPQTDPGSYTLVLNYTLSFTGNTLSYKEPVFIVDNKDLPDPTPIFPDAAKYTTVWLPPFSSIALVCQVPKAVVGMAIILASVFLMV